MSHNVPFSNGPSPLRQRSLGGIQNDIFFSVMKIIHRQNVPFRATPASDKVNRLSCCCRLSELLPLVRQLHDEARARATTQAGGRSQQAA